MKGKNIMSKLINVNLPSFLAVSIACGKEAKGKPLQYRTLSLNISEWSEGQVTQWLAAGIANITADRIGGSAKASGLEGLALIDYKARAAESFLSGLAGKEAYPGRKAATPTPKGSKRIPTLAACVAMIESAFDAEDLGMDSEAFSAFIAKSAAKMRAKRIQEAGRNPATYDAEESAKVSANGDSDDSESED